MRAAACTLERFVESDSATPTVRILTSIWESVLQRAPLGPDDNFFELGGDPSLAFELFAQITETCGRELPPSVIYGAPTILSLANLLDCPALPPLSPQVVLKPGAEGSPVFILHGLGSSVWELFDLVKHLRTGRTVYGLQAAGSDGASPPLARIEKMADFHVGTIRSVQPRGPYTLVGYSLGGLIAFEMARRLAARGEKIALLVPIDSYPGSPALWKRMNLAAAQVRYRMLDAVRSIKHDTGRPSLPSVSERMRFSDFLAWTRYKPRPYKGKIKFVRAESSHYPYPSSIWSPLVSEFEIETVPGNHHSCLSTHSKSLASTLSRCLAGSNPIPEAVSA